MALKLYSNPASPCSRNVATVCKELNLPYELVVVEFTKGVHKLPEYVKKQAFVQILYTLSPLDGDGFMLLQSRVIARYLAVKHENTDMETLYTSNIQRRTLVEQASIEAFSFYPSMYDTVSERVFKP
ncbi:hypothetical protein CONPUDRAFT_34049, partial [Coniophora puteana RWD-64-598 SS2]